MQDLVAFNARGPFDNTMVLLSYVVIYYIYHHYDVLSSLRFLLQNYRITFFFQAWDSNPRSLSRLAPERDALTTRPTWLFSSVVIKCVLSVAIDMIEMLCACSVGSCSLGSAKIVLIFDVGEALAEIESGVRKQISKMLKFLLAHRLEMLISAELSPKFSHEFSNILEWSGNKANADANRRVYMPRSEQCRPCSSFVCLSKFKYKCKWWVITVVIRRALIIMARICEQCPGRL